MKANSVLSFVSVCWLGVDLVLVTFGMGCMASFSRARFSSRVAAVAGRSVSWEARSKKETLLSALTRLDDEIAHSEKSHPSARLAVVTFEIVSIEQEIKNFEEVPNTKIGKEIYAKTLHQVFVSLNLYQRPMLASENEDYIANVNRKEMRRIELRWLRNRLEELQRERGVLHSQLMRNRALYAQLEHLVDSIWGKAYRPGISLEHALSKARTLRDALAAVSVRLRAAAEYAHETARLLDQGLPAWKLATVGKSGWERSAACADACALLIAARCNERSARRVLAAPAAPRAARTLRLALDYAFTDAMHDHKYKRATEIFEQFKDAVMLLINSIHQVLMNNLENLTIAEKDVVKCRRELRAVRVNSVVQKGLADIIYETKTLNKLKT